ncbi:P2Y purinoceptor 13-like [Polypterus senegalus]|uniref:P2Y purinoceptor 13-like n=1 Tax=Polypterus senegalus TaxID=55291 RepID=UPI0019664F3B|nr:P2Y purinoceptor 13-like [Polypterus senegalus]XP_039613854.1 P2Y purinoceptor 13-like [Polypterus senegalus]XP_039613863.1 P2Y purinoceptor 13-like [Polypterus senegalus]XP_039613868.1 P2Y purinoceptor 13-like [Polypterus senegalus]XP_039613869.1 P2Y purinoceptor 13-like [Polypterus senegalus]
MTSIPPPNNCSVDSSSTNAIVTGLNALVFGIAAIVYIVTVCVSVRIKSSSTFVVYLKNLIVADILRIVTFIVRVIEPSIPLNVTVRVFQCRYSDVIFYFAMYMSIILLGFIGFDRFLKIVKPLQTNVMKNKVFGITVSALAWICMFFLNALPNTILTDQIPPQSKTFLCTVLKNDLGLKWHNYVNCVNFAIFFIVFVCLVIFYVFISKKVLQAFKNAKCQGNTPNETNTRVFIIIIVFFICFTPYHCVRIPYLLQENSLLSFNVCNNSLHDLKNITLTLTMINVCLNPLIYIFLCKKYKNKLLEFLRVKKESLPGKRDNSSGKNRCEKETL